MGRPCNRQHSYKPQAFLVAVGSMQKCHWLADNFMSSFQNRRVISSSFHCLLAKLHPHLQLPLAPWHLWAHSVPVTDSNQMVFYHTVLSHFRNLIWFPRICSADFHSKIGVQMGTCVSSFINRTTRWWLSFMSVTDHLPVALENVTSYLAILTDSGGSYAHSTTLSNSPASNSNSKIAFCLTLVTLTAISFYFLLLLLPATVYWLIKSIWKIQI